MQPGTGFNFLAAQSEKGWRDGFVATVRHSPDVSLSSAQGSEFAPVSFPTEKVSSFI